VLVGDTRQNQTVVSQVMIGGLRGNNRSVTEGWPSRTKTESVILKYETWHSRSQQADIHCEAPESAQPGGPRDINFISRSPGICQIPSSYVRCMVPRTSHGRQGS